MSDPWLAVPLTDYEQHMSSADVQQLGVLSELFAEAIERTRPASVAVLGIAGGNGLERIDNGITTRIVGLDINPKYLEAVRQRYLLLHGLELHCVDLSRQRVELEPIQLVHAALVFEHVGTERCLDNAISMVAPGGNLSIVLQLPEASGEMVWKTQFSSIQGLKSCFSLINPAWMCELLAERGFRAVHETRRALPTGKGLWMGIFSAPEAKGRK